MVMFSIISMDFFQLDAAEAGYLTSFFGVLQMVSGCRCSGHATGGSGVFGGNGPHSLPASVSLRHGR